MNSQPNLELPISVSTVNPVLYEIEKLCAKQNPELVTKVVKRHGDDVYEEEIGVASEPQERLGDRRAITTIEVIVSTPGQGWLRLTQNMGRTFSGQAHDKFCRELLERLETLGIYHPEAPVRPLGFQP